MSNFQELLKEQQKTNELLVQAAIEAKKPPSLIRSFRDSLGEIIDNRRLSKKERQEDEKFQKKEGIVKVDENVAAGTREVIKQSKFFTDQIQSLETQEKTLGVSEKTELESTGLLSLIYNQNEELIRLTKNIGSVNLGEQAKLQKAMNNWSVVSMKGDRDMMQHNEKIAAMERAAEPSASQQKATKKKEITAESNKLKLFKTLVNQGKNLNDFLKNNKFAQGAKSFLGKALLVTGLIAFLKFISSPKFIEFARFLDKTIVPALTDIFNILMSVGKMVIKTIEKLGNIVLDPDRDTMTRVLAAIGLVVIAGIALFSKTIALFVGGLALKALLGFAGLTLGVLFSPIGAIILAVIAAVAGAFKAFKTYKEAREGGDSIALAMGKATADFIGFALGFFPDLIKNIIGSFVGLFSEELGQKIKDFSFSELISGLLRDLGGIIKTAFQGVFGYFKKIFMGQNEDEITAEIQDLERRKAETSDMEQGTKDRLDKQIKKLEEKRKKAREEGGRVGGLAGLLRKGDKGFTSEGAEFYKGGRASAGQSIMVGEAGPEFFVPTTDAQIFSARRTEEMIMAALARGMNGGGEGGSPTIVTADNSVRSNSSTTNVINETITPLDTLTTSVVSSV